MKKKPIIINQRLPLHVLEIALLGYLKDNYSRDYIIEQLSLDFKGENRIKKGFTLVNKVILNNSISDFINDNREAILNAVKKKDDLNIILISLVNSTFPFAFDVLTTVGKYFSVQEILSTEAIKKTISGIYGGNRSMENALYAVIPMFVEAGFFEREKPGIYKCIYNLNPLSAISSQMYLESFRVNRPITPDYMEDPYFVFLNSKS